MKINNRAKVFLVCGILILIATIVIFSIANENGMSSYKWLSLTFMLCVEAILFGGLILIEMLAKKSEQIIVRAGNGVVLIIYFIVSFAISLAFLCMQNTTIFLIIQIILFVTLVTLEIVLVVAGKSIYNNNKNVLEAVSTVNEMINSLSAINVSEEYKNQIEKIKNDLKYSDVSTVVPVDNDILENILSLENEFAKSETANDSIESIISNIDMLIKKRKMQVKNTKAGGL